MTDTTSPTTPMLDYPFSRTSRTDPPEDIARLRAEAPMTRVRQPNGEPAWLLTRYDDIRSVLADPRFVARYPGFVDAGAGSGDSRGANFMFSTEGADHVRLRGLVSYAFTPRYLENLRPRIEQLADDLLARMAARTPPVDLIEAYAYPLPIVVIFEMFGVPIDQHEHFRDLFRSWIAARLSFTGNNPDRASEAGQQLRSYVEGLLADKRKNPGDDLMSVLIAARDDDRLSEPELFAMITGLLVSGYVTSVNAIARGTLALLHNGQYTSVGAEPARIESVVEEILRYGQSGDTGVLRIATQDVRLGDVTIAKGEAVLTPLAAANRDPAHFAEPDRFDVARTNNAHLSFGHGAHHCVGAGLARLELQVAFGALARAFPTLRLATSYEEALNTVVPFIQLPGRPGVLVGGPQGLSVTW
jgi:cytochrome P450